MGRELRRKQAKREGKSLVKEEVENTNQIKKLFIIIAVLAFIAICIYLISAIFVTKELDVFGNREEEVQSSTVSNSILASSIFRQKEEEYYVYFYDYNEENSTITSIVNNKLSDKKVYRVDTSSAMNVNYVSDTGNRNAKNLDELQVVPQTLIKIVDNTITEYYESSEIEETFN